MKTQRYFIRDKLFKTITKCKIVTSNHINNVVSDKNLTKILTCCLFKFTKGVTK